MIECPYCGVYWDYQKEISDTKHFLPLKQKYKIKEQGDCVIHVVQVHPLSLIAELCDFRKRF